MTTLPAPPPAPSPTQRPKSSLGLILGLSGGGLALVVAILVIAAFLNGQVARENAERRYADAVDAYNASVAQVDEGIAAYTAAVEGAEKLAGAADIVLADEQAQWFDIADPMALTELADAVDVALAEDEGELPDQASTVEAEELDSIDALVQAAESLEDEAAALDASIAPFLEVEATLSEATPELESQLDDVRATAPERAAQTEGDFISSTAVSRIALEKAADAAAADDVEDLPWALGEYVRASEAVVASHEAELEEKERDGLLDERLEVEEFVRSIVGDTRVDFDWEPIVNGLGEGDSAGGYTWWWYQDGGYSTMSLSDSVARMWPDERYVGLVVHEAGHSITSQCKELLDTTFGGDVELMATAWAIGMGYDNPWGNGVDFYYDGVPPEQHYIEASKECR